jgi:hypothetical protein
MNTTVAEKQMASIINSAELLKHWQAHRKLTRRVIEAFPEKEFFEYSIGGMRPFAGMVQELLGIAAPGIRQIVMGEAEELNEHIEGANSKTNVLRFWDKATDEINDYWSRIGDEKFDETILAFGKFESTVGTLSFTSSTMKFITARKVMCFCAHLVSSLLLSGTDKNSKHIMKTVLVFRTSISSKAKADSVKPLLDNLMDKYEKWNFDLEDCDNILRVEAVSVQPFVIINNLKNAGFACEELQD